MVFHVLVISLANSETKPVANHANTHPKISLDVSVCNRHCAPHHPQNRFQTDTTRHNSTTLFRDYIVRKRKVWAGI